MSDISTSSAHCVRPGKLLLFDEMIPYGFLFEPRNNCFFEVVKSTALNDEDK